MSLLALVPSHAMRVVNKRDSEAGTLLDGVLKGSEDNSTDQDNWLDLLDRCRNHTKGAEAAQLGVNIVDRLWKRNGEDCSNATSQFRSVAEELLRSEFPYKCKDSGVSNAHQSGRQAGENYLNRIMKECFPDRPTPPPGSEFGNCGKYTFGGEAVEAGVNLVDRLWGLSGKNCSYATISQLRSDAERALLDEFPTSCRRSKHLIPNRLGRRAGAIQVSRVIKECSEASQ